MNCYDPDLVHPRISDAVRDTLDHANTVEIPTPRERLISEFAALMTDPNVTDPLGQFLYGKDDHGTDSSPVEKRTDQDHHPKSDPVFFDRSTSADTSAVRRSLSPDPVLCDRCLCYECECDYRQEWRP